MFEPMWAARDSQCWCSKNGCPDNMVGYELLLACRLLLRSVGTAERVFRPNCPSAGIGPDVGAVELGRECS